MEMLAAKAVQPSMLNLSDVQAVAVQHCHGARAASFTFPSGFKASYSGDCRPSKPFTIIGKGSTVCIHEATFDDELQGDAEAKNHSTTSEALGVAQAMGAKACVLTHFSQRYQKLPVMEHGTSNEAEESSAAKALTTEDVPMSTGSEEDESTNPEDDLAGPLEDVAETMPDQQIVSGSARQVDLPSKSTKGGAKNSLDETLGGNGGPRKSGVSAPEAVRFKLTSDMKVCVAFDYMRVQVGEIGQLEKFTPALLKLFAEEEKPEVDGEPAVEEGKAGKKGKEKGGKGKGKKQGK
ncbi:hypothetical protein KC324_g20420 [Hortaea werneckii]|nr:hypothetical protein KC324_g20420 [Hortaea werneckii]